MDQDDAVPAIAVERIGAPCAVPRHRDAIPRCVCSWLRVWLGAWFQLFLLHANDEPRQGSLKQGTEEEAMRAAAEYSRIDSRTSKVAMHQPHDCILSEG